MRKTSRFCLTTGLVFFSISAWGQTGNRCDLTLDGKVDAADVQAAINMSLGISPCTANVAGLNVCNVVVVQRVINASMGAPCTTSLGLHVVALNWAADICWTFWSAVRDRYKRRDVSRERVLALVDRGLRSTQGNYKAVAAMFKIKDYVVTTVNSSNVESSYSNQAQAVITVP